MSQNQTKIDRALCEGMTVSDLIEALLQMLAEAVVVFGSDFGDICHTEQALVVRRVEELGHASERLEASAYSHAGVAIEQRDDEGNDEPEASDEATPVVILRS